MSEQNKNPSAVDWAEKLKASMENTPDETEAPTPTFGEEDDLAALLRAQLAGSRPSADYSIELDMEGFEEETDEKIDEEIDEIIDDEPDETPDEEDTLPWEDDGDTDEAEEPDEAEETDDEDTPPWDEDDPDEDEDDDPDEEAEEYTEDTYEGLDDDLDEDEDDDPDEEAEEYTEDTYEGLDDDLDEDEDDDLDEESEDYTEDSYEGLADDLDEDEDDDLDEESENYAEDTYEGLDDDLDEDEDDDLDEDEYLDDDAPDEELYDSIDDAAFIPSHFRPLSEMPTPTASAPLKAPASVEEPLGDDSLNGLYTMEKIGGRRLQDIDEASTRLLRDETEAAKRASAPAYEETQPDAPVADSAADTPPAQPSADPSRTERSDAATSAPTPPAPKKRVTPVIRDPMQLDADDIRPTPKPVSAEKQSHTDAPSTLYTERMKKREGEAGRLRDTELLMHMGYEDALRSPEEQRRVEAVHAKAASAPEDGVSKDESAPKAKRSTVKPIAPKAGEKTTFWQSFACVAVALMGALFGLIYDYLPLLFKGNQAMTAFTDSFAYPLLELVWVVLVALPFVIRLGKGYKGLWDFAPTRYTVSALALTVVSLHSLISCFVPADHRAPLFGGVALLMLTAAAVADCLRFGADRYSASVVESGKELYMLTEEDTPAATALQDTRQTAAKGRKKKGKNGKTLTAVRTLRSADFGARLGRSHKYMRGLNFLIPVALLAAILAGGGAVALGGRVLGDGLSAFTATFLASLPAAYLCAMTLPLWQANRLLHEKGSTVVGEASATRYGNPATTLIFPDGDAIRPLYCKEITLRSDGDAKRWRHLAALTFRLMDCPLSAEPDMAVKSTAGYRLELAEQDTGYARFYLTDDNTRTSVEVMLGTHDALVRRGIRLPKANMEERYKKSRDSHVLYLAFDRRFHLAYAVEYRLGGTFLRTHEKLKDLGCSASVTTYDPMVSGQTPGLGIFVGDHPEALVTPSVVELGRKTRAGGLVATERSLDLLYPYTACRRIRLSYRISLLISWLAIPVSLGLVGLAYWLGAGALLTAATVTLWQMLITGAMVLTDLLSVNRKSLYLLPDPPKKSSKEN